MTLHIIKTLIKIIIFLFIINSLSFAEIKNYDIISKQKNFIFELYKEKRYFDCISETQRLLNCQNDPVNQNGLLYFINTCYFFGGQYKTVISRLKSTENLDKDKFYLANLFLLSKAYCNLGYYDKSRLVLNINDYTDIEKTDQDKLFVNRVERFINNYEYGNILSEAENAGRFITLFNKSFTLQDFRNDMEIYREIGLKSKWLSVSMSALLPGAGQIYSGRVLDGILSFVSVAGTAYGAYYFYNKNEKSLAITLSFFSGLFYCGNIYGAYNSALYRNNKLNRDFSSRIIKKYNLKYDPADYLNPADYFHP